MEWQRMFTLWIAVWSNKFTFKMLNFCVFVCLVQVPATAASVSAHLKIGGCLGTTVSVMIESVTNTTVSSVQVLNHTPPMHQLLWIHSKTLWLVYNQVNQELSLKTGKCLTAATLSESSCKFHWNYWHKRGIRLKLIVPLWRNVKYKKKCSMME